MRRVEDVRFLKGQGNYIEDLVLPGQVCAVVLRSAVAHAAFDVDAAAARSAPGVVLVLTGADLDAEIDNDLDALTLPNIDGTTSPKPRRPILAVDKVRYVGDPIAFVVAGTVAQARDAIELIDVDYSDLPVVTNMVDAMADDAPQLHEIAPGNVGYDWCIGDAAATESALSASHRTVTMDAVNNRIHVAPMETRGCIVDWTGEELRFHFSGQGVHRGTEEVGRRLGLKPEQMHALTPDVGGAFGMKNFMYPEYFCAGFASMKLGRPVKWVADRSDAILGDSAGRDNVTRLTMGFDQNNRITAFKTEAFSNLGAYNAAFGVIMQSHLYSRVLTGSYDIRTVWMNTKGVYTNTIPTDAYRGAGRPEAQYSLERFMDTAARELGLAPDELRRINFIKPDQFPYATPTGETYDVGDFDKVLSRGLTDLLAQRSERELPGRSYPNGCHVAEVEIDPDTGVTRVVKYSVVDDFGRLMNPMLAEGQVHGGVAQGIGQAITEHVVYDEDGQLLSASFMDYAMPRADDVPMVPFVSEPVYSTANYIGMKGCGEAGTVGALAAVTNAVLDALWDRGITHFDMPATPLRVWNWLQTAKSTAG